MKKIINWMDKSVTWGGLVKLWSICTAIGAIIGSIYAIVLIEPAWFKRLKTFVRKLFSKRTYEYDM